MAGVRLSGAAIALLLAILFSHGEISQAQFSCLTPPCLALFDQVQLRETFDINADVPTNLSLITFGGPTYVVPSSGSSITMLQAEITSGGELVNSAAETLDMAGAQKSVQISNDSVTISFFNFSVSANDAIPSLQFTLLQTDHLFAMSGAEYREVREILFRAYDSADRGTNVQIAEVRLNRPNNDSPVFSNSSYVGSVDENAVGGTVVSFTQAISATDADGVIYSLRPGPLDGVFTINRTSGIVKVVDSTTLDREDPFFGGIVSFVVVATDNHLDAATATAQVLVTVNNVNDNPPVFTQPTYTFDIPEELPSSYALSPRLMATDPDNIATDPIVYGLDPADITLLDDRFAVNSETGEITLLRRTDYETDAREYVFRVRATDQVLPPSTATVTVIISNIDDNRPQIAVVGLSTVYVDLTVTPPENGTFLNSQFSIIDDSDQLTQARIRIKRPVSWSYHQCVDYQC